MRSQYAVSVLVGLALTGIAFAAENADKPAAATGSAAFTYVGAAKCKRCHTTAKIGAQYKTWMDSKHAHAFLSLSSDSAKSMAAHQGVGDPAKAAACLQCHVTGHMAGDTLSAAPPDSEGVGCETCHGAGSGYWQRTKMIELRSGKVADATYGLVMPTKEVCAKCHNEKSPSGKFVDWSADSAKIAHPIPKDYKSEGE